MPATPNYSLRSPDSQETPFPEILKSYNGFEPGRGWMDLRAGMELRIENAYYRPGMPRRGLNGFLGTEVARYKVQARGGLELLSVDAMKDRPSEELPVQQLMRPGQMHYRCYRFFYEVLFRRSGSVRGSVILGGETKDEIERIAMELLSDPDAVCSASSKNCTVFPEACSVSIEMEIVVNGAARNVLWGSPLSDVVGHSQHVELSRIYKGRLAPVKIDARDADALRLPLLPGDRVTWSER
ncbi:MAG: hypothetical protein JO051_02870 [Acidobacteriaceae bacterium]|nr:hypothetical protein [Acidobacteriaceae bacterium]